MQENAVNLTPADPVDYRQARFLTSAAKLHDIPADRGREVAFAGRSNAGKSSAINALTGRRDLARTSRTPDGRGSSTSSRSTTAAGSWICRDTAMRRCPAR